jgi:hypothetical protein
VNLGAETPRYAYASARREQVDPVRDNAIVEPESQDFSSLCRGQATDHLRRVRTLEVEVAFVELSECDVLRVMSVDVEPNRVFENDVEVSVSCVA